MPTYDYECSSCGHSFERFQNITAEPLKRCPKCRRKVRRLIGTGAGIIFKGSGFYETDYRSDSYRAAAKKDKSDAESTPKEKGDSAKGDSAKGDSAKSDSKKSDTKKDSASKTKAKTSA